MIRALIIDQSAEDDMKEVYDFYELHSPGKGDPFLESCQQVFQRILAFPHLGLRLRSQVRKLPTPGFRYSVYYRVQANTIVVFGVLHQKRHAQHWKLRLDQLDNDTN